MNTLKYILCILYVYMTVTLSYKSIMISVLGESWWITGLIKYLIVDFLGTK